MRTMLAIALFLGLGAPCSYGYPEPHNAVLMFSHLPPDGLGLFLWLPEAPPWYSNAPAALGKALDRPFVPEKQALVEIPGLFRGSWPNVFRSNRFTIQGDIPLAGLKELLAHEDVTNVEFSFDHVDYPLSEVSLKKVECAHIDGLGGKCRYTARLGLNELPDVIHVQWGYGIVNVVALPGMCVLVLLAGLLLMYCLRRQALQLKVAHLPETWFRFDVLTKVVFWACGLLVLLLIALPEWQPRLFLTVYWWAVSGSSVFGWGLFLSCVGAVLVAAAAWTIIRWPVEVRLGVRTTSRLAAVLRTTCPLALSACYVSSIGVARSAFVIWAPWLAGVAVFCGSICVVLAGYLTFFPRAFARKRATAGEFRELALDLAAKVRTRVKHTWILERPEPLRGGFVFCARLVRANHLFVTDHVLASLNKDELGASIARAFVHERRWHFVMAVFKAAVFGAGSLLPFMELRMPLPGCAVALGLSWLLYASFCRDNEFAADKETLALTRDPEAMITGLIKQYRLNLWPLTWTWWEGLLLQRPSCQKRIKAIARQAGMADEYLAPLIASARQYPLTDGGASMSPVPLGTG